MKRTLCFSNPAHLSLHLHQLEVRLVKNDVLTKSTPPDATIPIEDIGFLILDHQQITLTQALVEELMLNNVALISCNSQHLPLGLMLPMKGNTLLSERCRDQLSCSLPLRKQLWQQTVQQKIRNQASILAQTRQTDPKCMLAWANQVRSGDPDNLEGRAAAYYWPLLFPMEEGFVRGQYEPTPNNLLNYGYAILRAVVARALIGAGLLPLIGIHHHNRYDAYCLADDIMEPYRPYVDQVVVSIYADNPDCEILTPTLKRQLLIIPTLDVTINGHQSPLFAAVQQTANSLQKCFAGELRHINYPEMKLWTANV